MAGCRKGRVIMKGDAITIRLVLGDPFWSKNFAILSLENPQTSIFMTSGFLGFVGTHIYGFNIPRYLIPIIYNRIFH